MNTRLSPQDFIQVNSKTLMDLFGKEEPAYSEKEVLWLMENYDTAPSGEGEIKKAMLQLKGLYKGEGEKMAEGWETELRKQFFKECTMGDFVDGTKIRIDFAPHDLFEWIKKNAIWPLKSIIHYQEQQLEGKAPESAPQIGWNRLEEARGKLFKVVSNNKLPNEIRIIIQEQISQISEFISLYKPIQSNK